MKILLLILLLLAVLTTILVLILYRNRPSQKSEGTPFFSSGCGGSGCCGGGAHCKEAAKLTPKIIYYDDEELDRFAGRDAKSYTEEEKAEIREVYSTLQAGELRGWIESIQLRKIELPEEQRAELLRRLAQEQ